MPTTGTGERTGDGFTLLATDRLVIRAMQTEDAPAFAAYRNDPDTALHQEWALPFTTDDAARFVEQQQGLAWPALGDWNQLALEHDGEMIGDVGVGWSDDGQQATIGYTLEPAHRGKGFATEAVGAVVDHLFAGGVHRVTATLAPENVASAQVLDRLGFRYEGRSVSAALVRGQWLDDDRYALLAVERAEWRDRSRRRPGTVTLVEIDWRNSRDVGRLATHHSQEQFVASMYHSFADALHPELDDADEPLVPWLRAVEADGELVGFMMLADVTATSPDPYLWRFLIDRRHQGRGIGRLAMDLLVERLRSEGHARLLTSWVPGRGTPEGFYLGLGFVPTGDIDDGEIVGALDLGKP